MPVHLKREPGSHLSVRFSDLGKTEFNDALARVRSIPGRRWNPDDKTNRFPDDIEVALRIVRTLQPVMDAATTEWVKDHSEQVAENLVTRAGDDAELKLPWADKLYAYQRAGVDFLAEHRRALLADDMGLGKTVQSLAAVLESGLRTGRRAMPVLVVCPNSVRGTWVREAERWLGYEATVIDGKTPKVRSRQASSGGALVVVNWEKLQRIVNLAPVLAERDWAAVIADEAHRMKNHKAQQTKAMWTLQAPIKFALSGTPVMNDPGDLWSILRWLYPESYGNNTAKIKGRVPYWQFFYMYVDAYPTDYGQQVVGVKNADALRFELADKLIRRTKKQVLSSLPEKLPTQHIAVDLKPKQRRMYDEAEEALWLDVEKYLEKNPEAAGHVRDTIESGNLQALRIPNAGARITRLRQIASTPAILDGPDDSAKLDAVEDLIRDHPNRPFVVFAWFEPTVRILAERLTKRLKRRVVTIAGSDDANANAEAFQRGDFDVAVCTIAKGGEGIDLFAADTCIFVERDWTPAKNRQAEDRLHRIGQTSDVQPIVLEAKDTIDTSHVKPTNHLKEQIEKQILGSDILEKKSETITEEGTTP